MGDNRAWIAVEKQEIVGAGKGRAVFLGQFEAPGFEFRFKAT